MIIFGSQAKSIAIEAQVENCNSCGAQNSINLNLVQYYAHVFWVPFIPTGKTGISQCQHCKEVLELKEFCPSTKLAYDSLKAKTKTPILMYTGVILVALFVLLAVYQDRQNDVKNAALILTPKQDDIFEIKTKNNQYTLFKVANVLEDSVYVRINQYETNRQSGLIDLKRIGDTAYYEETYVLLKSELKQMLEKREITDIDRK